MPLYFKLKLTVNRDIIDAMRQLPDRARARLRVKLQTVLKPELQADTDAIFEQGPEPVDNPFTFETPASRRKYFAIVTADPTLSDGRHWIRVGTTAEGFDVEVSSQFREGLITIRNVQSEARFLFGPPRAVIGHARTGWPDFAETARQLLHEKAVSRVQELWYEALNESVRSVNDRQS